MELWIRDQSRMHLLKLQGLGVFEKNDGFDIAYGFTTYGHYKTKERALEVLDEIQNFIEMKDIEGNRYYEGEIYEMPKE